MTTSPDAIGPAPAGTADAHLRATPLLDLGHEHIQELVERRAWRDLEEVDRIGRVYRFVRDEVGFGYNASDDLPASQVLADGYGQCNTKATLLMALLRASGIPCRFHGATIHKQLQRGVVTGILYRLAPEQILHSWVEVHLAGRWIRLEGVILDASYLDGLRRRFPDATDDFLGYGVGTTSMRAPAIEWHGEHTEIQMTGVTVDHGLFDDPDAFYREVGTNLTGVKDWIFRHIARHRMNRRVGHIRGWRRSP